MTTMPLLLRRLPLLFGSDRGQPQPFPQPLRNWEPDPQFHS